MSVSVDDLVSQVRSQSDEANTINVSPQQIIDMLNRAQRKAANILARRYDELFWTSVELPSVQGQAQYDIPAGAYGRRIEKIEVRTTGQQIPHEVKKISNRDRTPYVQTSTTTRPQYYSQIKNKIEFYPAPSAGLTITIHYNAAPERLVLQQGRITSINTGSNYVLLDALGSSLSTSTTGFNAYINFIDYVTGAVKGSAQILSLDTTNKRLNIKTSSLTRTRVLGKTLSTSLPSTLVQDDYVSLITGTCVAELPEAYQDYLIQYAVLELRRRHSEPTQEEFAALKELEDELTKAWTGRESSHRVRKASVHWSSGAYDRRRRLLS